MNIIEDENYHVEYKPVNGQITFTGTLRLGGLSEYAPIVDCLGRAVNESNTLTLSLKSLEFLNSSGIAMFSKFVINARNKPDFELIVIGSQDIPWQSKSLNNLKRLMPAMNLILE
ncbi:MAG: hypothetical protein OEY11_00150 [Gammaproteobacteria bacterium]|nr:hypothetical protein [Gammaproteobacteria bacterium]